MTYVTTIISVLIGGGILTFIQFLISRHDQKHDKTADIVQSINGLSDRIARLEEATEEREAIQARTHILRFQDELHDGMHHSKEYFEQTLDDIEKYSQYCDSHPKFANGRTKAASEFIKREHDRLYMEHKI